MAQSLEAIASSKIKKKPKKPSKRQVCYICGETPGRNERDARRYLTCQACSMPICDMCAVYGDDNLPRCGECHLRYSENKDAEEYSEE